MSIRYLLAAVLFAGGCVGDLTPVADDGDDDVTPDAGGNTGGGEARQMFERDVFPILTAKCGAGCHLTTSASSTPFVAPAVGTSYITATGFDAVVGNYTTTGAGLWLKIVPGPHNARTYTTDEQMKIQAWLAAEVTERNGTGPGPGPGPSEETPAQATARIISEWSGCLKLEDFTSLNFGPAFANKGSNEGNCEQCHTSGAYGFKANDDNAGMYETLSTNKYYMMAYFAADISDPNLANAKMVPNYVNFQRVGLRQVPHQEHPSFNTNMNDAAFVTLQQLYDKTMGYKTAGTCGTPRIPM
jgi:hypothetical protein